MNRDFSQAAANRAAAIKAICHNGERVAAGCACQAPSVLLNVRAQNHPEPPAGPA